MLLVTPTAARRRVQLADRPRGRRAAAEHEASGRRGLVRLRPPRRVVADASAAARSRAPTSASPTAPPTPMRARSPTDLIAAYVDGEVDQVEIIYNGYISPLTQRSRARRCCRSSRRRSSSARTRTKRRGRARTRTRPARARRVRARPGGDPRAAGPGLRRDLGLPRAARVDRVRARRAHDRDAQRVRERGGHHRGPHPGDDRQRQAEITQEIMEVVAGAEALL